MAKRSSDQNTPISGNDFHYRVASDLEAKDWEVRRSPYYVDMISRKSREIDIIARKSYPVVPLFPGDKYETLLVRLFIECKYIPASHHIDLYFEPKNVNAAADLAKDNNVLQDIDDNLVLSFGPKVHHYLNTQEVVKSWSPSGDDIFYKGWEQVLHAFIYYREHHPEGNHTVDYPLLIVSSSDYFFRRDVNTQSSSQFTSNFQLAVDYSYPIHLANGKEWSLKKYFLIDVVNHPILDSFLVQLEENDVAIMVGGMRSKMAFPRSRRS